MPELTLHTPPPDTARPVWGVRMVFAAGEDPYIHTGLTSAENTALWRRRLGRHLFSWSIRVLRFKELRQDVTKARRSPTPGPRPQHTHPAESDNDQAPGLEGINLSQFSAEMQLSASANSGLQSACGLESTDGTGRRFSSRTAST